MSSPPSPPTKPTYQQFIAYKCCHVLPNSNPSNDPPITSHLTALCHLCHFRKELHNAATEWSTLERPAGNDVLGIATWRAVGSMWMQARAAIANCLILEEGGDGCSEDDAKTWALEMAGQRARIIHVAVESEASDSEVVGAESQETDKPIVNPSPSESDTPPSSQQLRINNGTTHSSALQNNNNTQTRTVHFANFATIIHEHRDPDEYRDPDDYSRKDNCYVPGVWAPPDEDEEYLDTSGDNQSFDEFYRRTTLVLGKRKRAVEEEDDCDDSGHGEMEVEERDDAEEVLEDDDDVETIVETEGVVDEGSDGGVEVGDEDLMMTGALDGL